MIKKDKVLILTLRLGTNYGGILQAFALQEYLKQNKVIATTIDLQQENFIRKMRLFFKDAVRRVLHLVSPTVHDLPSDIESHQCLHTQRFIQENIRTVGSKSIPAPGELAQQYDALIVGSDQVWRSAYVPVEKYLFDFAEGQDITRLSYAASFGRDDLSEYNPDLLLRSARLARSFDAISVREDSGVDLVKRYWGMDAEQHLDPTFLLDKERFIDLVKSDNDKLLPSNGDLFVYVLDRGDGKSEVIDRVATSLKLKTFELLPQRANSRTEFFANTHKYQLPPVAQWLKSFCDAEFIITDSFHGTAFAIIFNKPFITIGNKERGLARFTSLLKIFGLENRLVSDISELTDELIKSKIDWKLVNTIKRNEQARSNTYLSKYLGIKKQEE